VLLSNEGTGFLRNFGNYSSTDKVSLARRLLSSDTPGSEPQKLEFNFDLCVKVKPN